MGKGMEIILGFVFPALLLVLHQVYITYYLKAAALLLYILERCKVNSRPPIILHYGIVITLVHLQIFHRSSAPLFLLLSLLY